MGWTGFKDILFMAAGGMIWAARFVLAYSMAALSCAKDFHSQTLGGYPLATTLIVAVTVIALGAQAIVIAVAMRGNAAAEGGEFIRWVAAGVALLGALAMVWESFVLFLPACT